MIWLWGNKYATDTNFCDPTKHEFQRKKAMNLSSCRKMWSRKNERAAQGNITAELDPSICQLCHGMKEISQRRELLVTGLVFVLTLTF